MRIKGAVILARRGFVLQHFGAARWQDIIDSLQVEVRTVLGGMVLASQWYPFAYGAQLDEAIVRVLGRGSSAVIEEVGRRSATENLGGVHRNFLVSGDPQRFLEKTPTIYRLYYDSGERDYVSTGPTSGVLTTRGADTFSAIDCLTVVGWYKEALAMCGARGVEVTEETCRARGEPQCRYRVSWSRPITARAGPLGSSGSTGPSGTT